MTITITITSVLVTLLPADTGVQRSIGPMTHWSGWKLICPTCHWSENVILVRRPTGSTTHWPDKVSLVRRPLVWKSLSLVRRPKQNAFFFVQVNLSSLTFKKWKHKICCYIKYSSFEPSACWFSALQNIHSLLHYYFVSAKWSFSTLKGSRETAVNVIDPTRRRNKRRRWF